MERIRAHLIFDFLTKTDSIRPQSAFAVYTKFDFRIKMKVFRRDSVGQRAFGSGQPMPLFILMIQTVNTPKCHSKRCKSQALVIHRRQWFCVVHALVSARIRQFVRSLRGVR